MRTDGTARGTRWLLADRADGRMTVHVLGDGDDRVLPVFGFRDEAEMYARLQLGASRWEAVEVSPGEMVSFLCGPLSDVRRVALDPLPEVCGRFLLELLCVRREAFAASLIEEGKANAARAGCRRRGPAAGHPAAPA